MLDVSTSEDFLTDMLFLGKRKEQVIEKYKYLLFLDYITILNKLLVQQSCFTPKQSFQNMIRPIKISQPKKFFVNEI